VSLVIFGSYARKENKLSSDLDILIILRTNRPRHERIREFVEEIEMPLEHLIQGLIDEGIFVDLSPIIFSEEGAKYFNPIYLDMVEHSIISFSMKANSSVKYWRKFVSIWISGEVTRNS